MNPIKIINPKTLDEAIKLVFEALTDGEKEAILNTPPEAYHFTVGMSLRNSFGFWHEKNPVREDVKKRFDLFGHPDDVSGLLLSAVWAQVRGEDIEKALNTTAEEYRRHWIAHGLDPKTGKAIK